MQTRGVPQINKSLTNAATGSATSRAPVAEPVTGDRPTVAQLIAVARERAPVRPSGSGLAAMSRSADGLAAHVASGGAVYGITTGLGARVGQPVAARRGLGEATLRGRAVAVGEPLPADLVRAAMFVRMSGLLAGGSGAAPAVATGLAGLLNAGVHPTVPRIGSLGAADLCLMAHIGLVLIGEGSAEYGDRVLDGGDALRAAGLTRIELGPRDGLAICSSSAVSVGSAALALADLRRVLDAAQISAALAMEAFRAGVVPLSPDVVAARPAPGQGWAAAGLLALLAGGALLEPGAGRRLQDPLSFRGVAAVHGALAVSLDAVQAAVVPELGSAADSPLVLDGSVITTANFLSPALGVALDAAAIAAAQVGDALAQRPARLAAERFSGLPEGLAADSTRSGVAPLEKTARALAFELIALAAPRSLASAAAADGAEDAVTGALPGALRLLEVARLLARLVAVELVVAGRAVGLRGDVRLGEGTGRALAWVRSMVPGGAEDRPLGPALESMAMAVLDGDLSAMVNES